MIILAGMSAKLCVEAHLRELIEQGFEVTCGEGRDGWPSASRAGGRLRISACQLRVYRQWGPDNG